MNGAEPEQAPGPWPSAARVRVRELSWQGPYNPRPQSKSPGGRRDSHGKRLAEECLSAARLVSGGARGSGQGPARATFRVVSRPCWPGLCEGVSRCLLHPGAEPRGWGTDVQAQQALSEVGAPRVFAEHRCALRSQD